MTDDIPQITEEEQVVLSRIRQLARLFDTAFNVPGTKLKFGLDPVIGLVPVVGDFTSLAVSSYLIWEARRLGLPKHVLARMVGNVAVDTTIGAIPLLGDAFDLVFRANTRNLRLLEKSLLKRTLRRRP